MARRTFDHVWTLGKGRVNISGRFATNSTSDPAAASTHGAGFNAIKHSATGKYTVPLQDPYHECIAAFAHLSMNSPDGSYAQAMPVAADATSVVIYTLNSVGTAIDIAPHANNVVNFEYKMKNSSARV